MNLWVLIGFVLLIGLLMMGKNPVREFQNEQKEIMQKYGNDEITVRTNLYLEQQQQKDAGGMFATREGYAPKNKEQNSYSSLKEGIEKSATPVGNDPRFIPKGIAVAKPSEEFNDTGVEDLSTIQTGKTSTKKTERPKTSYYPPLVKNKNEERTDNIGKYSMNPNAPKLRSGQPLSYEGDFIFTFNEKGQRVFLPDGDYIMENGTAFSVSGGRRQYKN